MTVTIAIRSTIDQATYQEWLARKPGCVEAVEKRINNGAGESELSHVQYYYISHAFFLDEESAMAWKMRNLYN